MWLVKNSDPKRSSRAEKSFRKTSLQDVFFYAQIPLSIKSLSITNLFVKYNTSSKKKPNKLTDIS